MDVFRIIKQVKYIFNERINLVSPVPLVFPLKIWDRIAALVKISPKGFSVADLVRR